MDLDISMGRLCLRQSMPALQVSRDTYNKLFFINTHSIDATVQVYADSDRTQKGASQFINHLQCRICEKVFHKAFGLEFHLNHEHDANEKPVKRFEVKTFNNRRGESRHKKGGAAKSKKSKKKSKKDWDLENAWRDDDSDETDGQVVYDDETDLDIMETDDDDILLLGSPVKKKSGKGKQEAPKTIIDTFDAGTAAVLAGFKELQPTVYIRNIYEYPDAAGTMELPPLVQPASSRAAEPQKVVEDVTAEQKDDPNDESVVSYDSDPADPTDFGGMEDSVNIWEQQEMEAEEALMQQLEDVLAPSKPAAVSKAAVPSSPKKEKVTRDITVKVMDENGTRDIAGEVTHKVTPVKADVTEVTDKVIPSKSDVTEVIDTPAKVTFDVTDIFDSANMVTDKVTPIKVSRDSAGATYKVTKDKSKKVTRPAQSEDDSVVNLDTPTKPSPPKKYKPGPASKKKKPIIEEVTLLDTSVVITEDKEKEGKKADTANEKADTNEDAVKENGDSRDDKAIPFVCCKFVTVESTDDESDPVDVVNVESPTKAPSPVKKYKPSPLSKKKQSPSIKHINITKKKEKESPVKTEVEQAIKKDITPMKKKSKAPPKDDSDSDIEIIMSPTAPKKKTPANSKASKPVGTVASQNATDQRLAQIRQMVQRQSAAFEAEKKRRTHFISDVDDEDELDWADELNGPNAWKPSPKKKAKVTVQKETSLGTPSHYSSSGSTGTVSPMEMGSPLKPLGLEAEKTVAKRRLFTNSPNKVQPKKAKTPLRPPPTTKPDDDEDLICLD